MAQLNYASKSNRKLGWWGQNMDMTAAYIDLELEPSSVALQLPGPRPLHAFSRVIRAVDDMGLNSDLVSQPFDFGCDGFVGDLDFMSLKPCQLH